MKCKICKKVLSGYKKKFCSRTCYLNSKSASAKRRVALSRRDTVPKECSVCKTEFYPLRETHYTCSKPCSFIRTKQVRGKKKETNRKFKLVKPMEFAKANPFLHARYTPKIEFKTTAEFNSSSTTKDEVLAFLKDGGKIQKFPDEPTKKTPSVTIPFEYIDEELYGTSDVSEQPSLEQTYGNQY